MKITIKQTIRLQFHIYPGAALEARHAILNKIAFDIENTGWGMSLEVALCLSIGKYIWGGVGAGKCVAPAGRK